MRESVGGGGGVGVGWGWEFICTVISAAPSATWPCFLALPRLLVSTAHPDAGNQPSGWPQVAACSVCQAATGPSPSSGATITSQVLVHEGDMPPNLRTCRCVSRWETRAPSSHTSGRGETSSRLREQHAQKSKHSPFSSVTAKCSVRVGGGEEGGWGGGGTCVVCLGAEWRSGSLPLPNHAAITTYPCPWPTVNFCYKL